MNPFEARQAVLDAVGEKRGSHVDHLLGEFARLVQEHTERWLRRWYIEHGLPAGPEGSGVQQDGAATDRPAVAATEDTDSPSSPARQGCCAACESAITGRFRPSRKEM